MIKIFHEAPISIFPYVQTVTDGDYCLVHLLEEHPEYVKVFEKACQEREVILDNSIFEKGIAFETEPYKEWIKRLQPTWYIIPDALENFYETITKAHQWNRIHRSQVPGKAIGVVQGKTYTELCECYIALDKEIDVDMIAISFDYSWYEEQYPDLPKPVAWMLGRQLLLARLTQDGLINYTKKHHLLGVALPQEGVEYGKYGWLYSIDTSNPVVHAIHNIKYESYGLTDKVSKKLCDLIEYPSEDINFEYLTYNINAFRQFWNS
jgi:hypothetical protein